MTMTVRSTDLPPALPCGDDPLDRTCGIHPAGPNASVSADNNVKTPILRPGAADLCRACLPRFQKLVKLDAAQ